MFMTSGTVCKKGTLQKTPKMIERKQSDPRLPWPPSPPLATVAPVVGVVTHHFYPNLVRAWLRRLEPTLGRGMPMSMRSSCKRDMPMALACVDRHTSMVCFTALRTADGHDDP